MSLSVLLCKSVEVVALALPGYPKMLTLTHTHGLGLTHNSRHWPIDFPPSPSPAPPSLTTPHTQTHTLPLSHLILTSTHLNTRILTPEPKKISSVRLPARPPRHWRRFFSFLLHLSRPFRPCNQSLVSRRLVPCAWCRCVYGDKWASLSLFLHSHFCVSL